MKLKTVYCLRIRLDCESPWSDTDYYRTRKERDDCARINRIIGGLHTHSFEEKRTAEEINELTAE